MNQNAISRLENPNYGKPTITTLKRIATAFDVALVVRFVPISQLVDWVSGTPRIDLGLNPLALAVPSFDEEVRSGHFGGHTAVVTQTHSEMAPKQPSPGKVINMAECLAGKEQDEFLKAQRGRSIPNVGEVLQTGGGGAYAKISSVAS